MTTLRLFRFLGGLRRSGNTQFFFFLGGGVMVLRQHSQLA